MSGDARVRSGVCSVTFRQLPPEAIVDLAVEAGLDGIEWGGDVHVPPGRLEEADRLARRCRDAGLALPSYGSYLVAGEFDQPVSAVMDTAATLGVDVVRVWAGTTEPDPDDDVTRQRVAGHLASLVDRAAGHGLSIAVEFHEGTLTADAASTLALLDDVADDRLRTYWQPRAGAPVAASLAELALVGPRLAHLHTFWWDATGARLPLEEGADLWAAALAAPREGSWPEPPGGRFAFLEFVAGDHPDTFRRDAATLRRLASESP